MPNIRNWPLTWQVVDQMIDHPETHDQGQYITRCGTAACFAGWTTSLAGFAFIRSSGTDNFVDYVATPNGPVHVRDKAVELLGIADNDWESSYRDCADLLFGGGNDMLEILRLLCDWADEDGADIPERVTRVATWMKANDCVDLFTYGEHGARIPLEGIPA